MTAENRAVVQSLADAWAAQDIDAIMDHFTDDIVYHNMPMEPAEGREAVREAIEGFLAMADSILFETRNEVSDGDLVLNERVDTFVIGGNPTPIEVMGTFELRDGKIARWRDYFDMSGLTGG
ncbi:MAG: nuclear transport factor 2 family protein [Acidimicrobiales bacterium]|nr:nuclear transport factor 2 family protein [Acidimicrobiales bacterium]